MGKKNLSVSPWLTAVKRAFRSPSKDNSATKQEDLIGEEKKREKKTRWLFRKPTKADKREPIVRPSREDCAAISIQTAFRGFLARRALKALRGLVKLQALVRGHNVRKQAQTTLHCMQALVRVQSQILNQRAATLEDTRRRSIEMQRSLRGRHKSFGNEVESNTHFTPPSKVHSTISPRYSREEMWPYFNKNGVTPPNQPLPNYMAVTESAKAKVKARAQRLDIGSTVRKRLMYKGSGYGTSCSSVSTPSFKSVNGLMFRQGVKVEQLSNYSSCCTDQSFVVSPSPPPKSKFHQKVNGM
ncbi:protein IQ-DOMAIN 18-like [Impatiens glandulifera]|uniref:protein IQ-DOMAIN 18-like n=1 Tax=Impatiens glandulifera TaxID=253017 RepID=UPI001FB05925|nr:protein IQ-DOMAIN 18-like [Impatiens glandulifera]